MNFFLFLKQLNELLYEVMSWVVFYPVTLWRSIRNPMKMADYANGQLADGIEAPFNDALSPPIFLLVTVLISHGIESALIGESRIIARSQGLAGLVDDNASLIILRLVMFATFPTIVATDFVRRAGVELNRLTLEEPFYEQCYATAPCALVFSFAFTFFQTGREWSGFVAAVVLLAAAASWLAIQTLWFGRRLGVGRMRAFLNALLAFAQCLAVLLAFVWLLAGRGVIE